MADAKKCDRCGDFYELREPDLVETLAGVFFPFECNVGISCKNGGLGRPLPKMFAQPKKMGG